MIGIESDAGVTCAMAVMAKASNPGRVKTRMVPPLTAIEASDLNTAFLVDISHNMKAAQQLAAISPWMAFAPAGSAQFFETNLPSGIGLLETVGPNLGECLLKAASSLLDRGYQSACLINSDSPTLPAGYLVAAANLLAADGDRIVLGPSTDGGYYLIGMTQRHRRLFEDIDWSTERVFGQTLVRASEIGVPVVVLPTWYDVDDAGTVCMLIGELFEGQPFRVVGAQTTPADSSRALLARLLRETDLARRIGLGEPSARVA